MHEPSFLTGVKLGEYLTRLTTVETRVDSVEKKVNDIESTMKRGAILAALWLVALFGNVYPDKAAEIVVEIARSALKP
jgi:hypothetical protein